MNTKGRIQRMQTSESASGSDVVGGRRGLMTSGESTKGFKERWPVPGSTEPATRERSTQNELTHSHRNKQPSITALYQQRDVSLRLLHSHAKVRSAGHRRAVGGNYDVARLEPRIERRALGLLDEQTLRLGLALFLAGQRPNRQSQLATSLSVVSIGRCPLVIQLGELDAHFAAGMVSPDFQLDRGARLQPRNHRGQLARRIHIVAIQLEDHVARLDTGLRSSAAFLDTGHQRAFGLGQPERVGQTLIDVLDDNTELAARDVPTSLELRADTHRDINRNRE